jgi:hypothetical protein
MNSYIKMLVIVAIVATVGTVSAMTTIVQNAKAANVGSTYCDGKYSAGDSRDGCVSGQADCKGGKKYDTGKGHSGEFVKGYDAGWVHEGCKLPTSAA